MADYPSGSEPPAGPARPGIVTAAGVLLIIAGALQVLFGLLFVAGAVAGGGFFTLIAIVLLAVGAVEIYAGIKVLGLQEVGRRIGLAVAAVVLLFNLLSIRRAPVSAIVGIVLNGFILYALIQHGEHFRS